MKKVLVIEDWKQLCEAIWVLLWKHGDFASDVTSSEAKKLGGIIANKLKDHELKNVTEFEAEVGEPEDYILSFSVDEHNNLWQTKLKEGDPVIVLVAKREG